MNRLAMHTYTPSHPMYASRTWQQAFFNSSRQLSYAQRHALATAAYNASQS